MKVSSYPVGAELAPPGRQVKGLPLRDVVPAIGFRPVGDCVISDIYPIYIKLTLKGGDIMADENQNLNAQPTGFDSETLAKLTTELAGDVDLYNKVINTMQEKEQQILQARDELNTYKQKLEEAEQRGQQYLNQISNLLAKIPVGESRTPQTFEQKLEEIKNRPWSK